MAWRLECDLSGLTMLRSDRPYATCEAPGPDGLCGKKVVTNKVCSGHRHHLLRMGFDTDLSLLPVLKLSNKERGRTPCPGPGPDGGTCGRLDKKRHGLCAPHSVQLQRRGSTDLLTPIRIIWCDHQGGTRNACRECNPHRVRVPPAVRADVLSATHCALCELEFVDVPRHHPLEKTVDHIVPWSVSRSHDRANLQPAHSLCNRVKWDDPEGWELWRKVHAVARVAEILAQHRTSEDH